MQTPKSRPGSLNVPQKTSPTMPRAARKLKTAGLDSDSHSSPKPAGRIQNNRSPKVDCQSPRNSSSEKKRSSRVAELEARLAQLQEELKQTKDELSSSQAWTRSAKQEAEEAKKRLITMSTELEETLKKLKERSGSENNQVHELCQISQDRDRRWRSQLEAIKKQQMADSADLASALSELQTLKLQLGGASEKDVARSRHAESSHGDVIHVLRLELSETLEVVEDLTNKLNESKESEAQTLEEVGKVQMLLEDVKTKEETLHAECASAAKSYESLLMELEESKNRVNLLEELVGNLQVDLSNNYEIAASPSDICKRSEMLKIKLSDLKDEASELRHALEAAEGRCQDQYLKCSMQVRKAYELVEQAKSESFQREVELEVKLKESMSELDELNSKLTQTENALQSFSCKNRLDEAGKETALELELRKSKCVLQDLKTSMLDKEMRVQSVAEENEMLKSELAGREMERSKEHDEVLASARAAERDTLMKLRHLTEEADESYRKAERITQQLDAAQAGGSEMEAELRRLKVQSDQWRKAAEAAAAMLSTEHIGKYVERTGSLDYNTIGGRLRGLHSEDIDDYSPKKRNGSMLKKIGLLLKKGSK